MGQLAYAAPMPLSWIVARRMTLAYTFTGWIMGAILMLTNDGVRISDVLTQSSAWRCAMVGLILSGLVAPFAAFVRPPRWTGLLIGPLATVAGIYLYFVIWPHSWQPTRADAWKSVAMVIDVYWHYLLPCALLGGLGAQWWASRARAARPPG